MSYKYLTEQGVIIPDTSDTRQTVVTEWKTALGEDLITDDETPQGLLINAETEARQTVARNNAALANQINPNLAEGVFLDAIWALTGGARVKATYTQLINVLLTGVAGTEIAEGVIAQAAEYSFKSLSKVILDAEGKAIVNFQAVDLGAIPCPANSLTKIITPILGWETINNPSDSILGKEQENDISARIRRKRTLARQGRALPEAIISDLYALDGVKSLAFRENTNSEETIIDNICLKPHSIWVCVDGGSDTDIANSLLNSKSLGAGYNGKHTISVTEAISGQTYDILFDRPEPVQLYIKVTVQNTYTAIDPQYAARSAIMNYVNGEQEGEDGLVVGADVSPFELSAAINKEYPQLFIKKIELSTDNNSYTTDVIAIRLDQIARVSQGSIQVVSV